MKFNTRGPLLLPALSAIIILAGLASCSKSNGSSSSALSANFGSKAFSATQTIAVDETSQITLSIIGVQAVSGGDSIGFALYFPDDLTPQTINFDYNGGPVLEYLDSKGTFEFNSLVPPSHGTLVLSTFDKTGKKVAGSFSGVLYSTINSDSVVVTNGKFNLSYQTE